MAFAYRLLDAVIREEIYESDRLKAYHDHDLIPAKAIFFNASEAFLSTQYRLGKVSIGKVRLGKYR